MGMVKEDNKVVFEGVVYEDEIITLRDFLQECSPSTVKFDFTECNDLHMGIIQVVLAYKKLYDAEYQFGDERKLYQLVFEGFEGKEEHCA